MIVFLMVIIGIHYTLSCSENQTDYINKEISEYEGVYRYDQRIYTEEELVYSKKYLDSLYEAKSRINGWHSLDYIKEKIEKENK